jgi:ABC-type Fe3+ transport system permease subunit
VRRFARTWRRSGALAVALVAALALAACGGGGGGGGQVDANAKQELTVWANGAGAWREFRRVTLPLLRPTLAFAAVVTSIGYLQVFEEPFVMTDGGPLNRTLTVSMYMVRQAFSFFHLGYASAVAYTLFVAILALSALQLRVFRSRT